MSFDEYDQLVSGKTLVNKTTWSNGYYSTSKGFCFIKKGHILENGILRDLFRNSTYMLKVEFSVKSPLLRKSKAQYPFMAYEDWYGVHVPWITEYCTTSYSIRHFHIQKVYLMESVKYNYGITWFKTRIL